MIKDKLHALLESKLSEPDYADTFLVELDVKPNNRVAVFLDSDGGISFDTCTRISRYLEEHIDAEGWLGEKYVLEVSSPGATRPLALARQYPKHVGRKLEVKTDQGKYKGVLTEVSEASITLEYTEKVVDGKKKKRVTVQKEIPFDRIEKAVVKLSF